MSAILEYPSIFEIGRREMNLTELRTACVDGFPQSSVRHELMLIVENLCTELTAVGLDCEVWVDGSFLSHKMDPNDIDIVVANKSSSPTATQTELLNRIITKTYHPKCDSYTFYDAPQGDPDFPIGELMRSYWIRQFCFNRNEQAKGMASIGIPL